MMSLAGQAAAGVVEASAGVTLCPPTSDSFQSEHCRMNFVFMIYTHTSNKISCYPIKYH